MGHSAFAQTHKRRKMGFNYTHLLIANVGQIINVLQNKARERKIDELLLLLLLLRLRQRQRST